MNKKVVLLSLNYLDMSCVRLVRIVNDEQVLALNIHLNENKNVYAHFFDVHFKPALFFDKTSKKRVREKMILLNTFCTHHVAYHVD